jgi:hypothetical protein
MNCFGNKTCVHMRSCVHVCVCWESSPGHCTYWANALPLNYTPSPTPVSF